MPALLAELDAMLELAASGKIFATEQVRGRARAVATFEMTSAFSGDGEPTTFAIRRDHRRLLGVEAAARAGRREMVLITNASMFHRPMSSAASKFSIRTKGRLGEAGGRDRRILQSSSSARRSLFQQILDNITAAARVRPPRDSSAVHADRGRAAAGRRASRILRPADRDQRRRRNAQARANLHGRPPSRGEFVPR